jgi:hypothetical protein
MQGYEEETASNQAWLDGVRKGDVAVVRFSRGIAHEYYKSVVDLVATVGNNGPRRIYVDGRVFNSSGSYFLSHQLVEPTPETLNEVERSKLHARMLELDWRRLPVVVLAKVVALVESDPWEAERAAERTLKK